jgi:hypothetical protein
MAILENNIILSQKLKIFGFGYKIEYSRNIYDCGGHTLVYVRHPPLCMFY